ncbi:hypothetical protein JMJ58_21080 (plasmid) [Haloterrigena salifodinae]|uniref:SWIM-type domain-containing protein n=1 Tax=Haloterrigena salifodinae TaxID=2675099 RepID=A0A8T8E7W5_9EURY|nr:hypothetical protein [Haloterrigena salifodinae]QRV17451.1 hypothetical protein JMJ58_21080 [Haloterrigena salifodinae]
MSTDRPSHREQHQNHHHDRTETSDREQHYTGDVARLNGHELVAIDEWLPGTEPTPYEIDLTDGFEYRTRYWRCQNCGQERNRRDEFSDPCETPDPPTPLEAGGYSIGEPRTRRALSEEMDVQFAEEGSIYEVVSESGNTYTVDLEAETCTCPDYEQRQPTDGCKHLRRVDLEIRTGITPTPEGTFNR